MAMEHDKRSGFLRGESIADEIDSMVEELQALRSIESNTREAVGLLRRMANMPAPSDPGRRTTATAPNFSQRSANDSRTTRQKSSAGPSAPRAPSAQGPRGSAPSEPGGARDGKGRFVAGQSSASGRGASVGVSASADSGAAIKAIGDALRNAAGSAASGADSIDPTIQAGKELGSIFSPVKALFKPLGGLFGGSKEAKEAKQRREGVSWLRRIWRTQADANKKTGGGGFLSKLVGMFAAMLTPLLGMLLAPLKLLGALTGLSKLGNLLGRGSGSRGGSARGSRRDRMGSTGPDGRRSSREAKAAKAGKGGFFSKMLKSGGGLLKGGGLLGGAAKLGKGLLKRIPLLGALFGGGMAINALMKDAKTPEEKQEKWGAVGGSVGGLLGGALGMLGGPAGAIAGGILGDFIGEQVGSWLATADLGAMIDSVTGVFSSVADSAKELASGAFDFVQKAWAGLVENGNKLFGAVKDWAAGKLDTVQDAAYTARDKVSEGVSYVADKGKNLLNTVTGGSYGGGSNAAKQEMIAAMGEAGIRDPKSQAALMANVDHESGGFKSKEENLNYSAKRLQEVFPKYYKTPEDARADAGNPEAIANKVYGGRMGNKEAGDGFKYRGRGLIQLTGRDQYEKMSKETGVDLVSNPEMAADPKIAAKIAASYWKTSGADKAAQAGDMVKARKLVNGGTNGLEDVQGKTAGYLAQAQNGELAMTKSADQVTIQAPKGAQQAMVSTMAAVKGTGPIGVMAPTQSVQPVPMASVAATPTSASTASVASYAPPAPDANLTSIPATAEVRNPGPAAPAKSGTTEATVPLTQNVGDRQIAHASAGGIGMGMMRY